MSTLSQPLALPSGSSLPNRIAKSAMSERLADARGHADERLTRLYARWSKGGAGLLITGNVMVDPTAIAEPGNVVLDRDHPLPPLRAWAEAATGAGNHSWVQLNHPGRQVPRSLSVEPVAPSAVAVKVGGVFATPKELTEPEIEAIIERFAQSAARARQAGFTGVQLHAAHGYLISQFLSPLTNLRTDGWGGDPERRRRFLLAVVKAVREAVGEAFPVGVKLNSADFQRGGFDQQESMAVVEALEAAGIDLLEISGGTYERSIMFAESNAGAGESTQAREAFFLEYAEAVRSRTSLPIMLTGGFRSGAAMSAALESGAVDVAGLARPLAVEPDLPRRLLVDPSAAARVVSLSTGSASVDGMVVGVWYGRQLVRMGQGLEPAMKLSRVAAVGFYLADHLRTVSRRLTGVFNRRRPRTAMADSAPV